MCAEHVYSLVDFYELRNQGIKSVFAEKLFVFSLFVFIMVNFKMRQTTIIKDLGYLTKIIEHSIRKNRKYPSEFHLTCQHLEMC